MPIETQVDLLTKLKSGPSIHNSMYHYEHLIALPALCKVVDGTVATFELTVEGRRMMANVAPERLPEFPDGIRAQLQQPRDNIYRMTLGDKAAIDLSAVRYYRGRPGTEVSDRAQISVIAVLSGEIFARRSTMHHWEVQQSNPVGREIERRAVETAQTYKLVARIMAARYDARLKVEREAERTATRLAEVNAEIDDLTKQLACAKAARDDILAGISSSPGE